jgi:hypothetical protein
MNIFAVPSSCIMRIPQPWTADRTAVYDSSPSTTTCTCSTRARMRCKSSSTSLARVERYAVGHWLREQMANGALHSDLCLSIRLPFR